jgi:putative transposase
MKKKCFSVEQIVAVLKQAELGMPVADIIRQLGISEQTFFRWKKQYAGLQSDQVREFKHLQDGNGRLKKLVAELNWIRRYCRTSLQTSGPACAEEGGGELHRKSLRPQHAAGLPSD